MTTTNETPTCGALTATGEPCKAKIAEPGERCWRHAVTATVKEPQPKPTGKDDAGAASLAVTAGEALLPLLTGNLTSVAKALAAGKDVPHTQLVKLRDGINAQAAKLREADKREEAKALSRANRLVRRLERAARGEG